MTVDTPVVAVITIAHGRHDHLRGQVAGLTGGTRVPDLHVVGAMDDPDAGRLLREAWGPGTSPAVVVDVPADPRGLPLAAARNRAAAEATARGADHLIFLDVDCIPGPRTVAAYAQALTDPRPALVPPAVLGGDVAYLSPLPPGQRDWTAPADLARLPDVGQHRPDRVVLEPGEIRPEPDLTRFWSLSFAMTVPDFWATGGFCTDFVGYGGEDTDFAHRLRAKGRRMRWVGGAHAYHQWHPVSSPPWEHLDDILANAERFHRRWGMWPMRGWLDAFAEAGAIVYARGRWRRTR